MKKTRKVNLCECVEKTVDRYITDLNGEPACGIYQMMLGEIERPLFEVVMKHAGKNQSKASRMLGITRNTLRKKLGQYGLND